MEESTVKHLFSKARGFFLAAAALCIGVASSAIAQEVVITPPIAVGDYVDGAATALGTVAGSVLTAAIGFLCIWIGYSWVRAKIRG
jgi:hypothetical protein